MLYRNYQRFTLACLSLCVCCCLCLLPLSLSGQPAPGSGTLPEWLELPALPIVQPNSEKPLILRLVDSLESWDKWSIEVETWYQGLKTIVQQMQTSLDKQEAAHKNEIAAKDAEISLLRSIIKNQPSYIVGAGGGGLLAGFALGMWAGASIPK